MRKLNWKSIVLAVVYLVLGVVFLVPPEGVEEKLCYVLAASMGIVGLLYLFGHFFQKVDEGGHREGYGFAFGALLIILAIFVVEKQQMLLAMMPFLFGIMVLIRGLIVVQNIFFFRRMGLALPIPLIFGALTIGLGLVVMLYPFEKMSVLFTLTGIGLVAGGIAGIMEEILVFAAARKQDEVQEQ